MSKRMYIVETEEKDRSGWWTILVAGLLLAYWHVILIMAILTLVAYLMVQCYRWNKTRQRVIKVREANAYLDAPTKLITEGMRVWGDPEHYLDDYDDGLRSWR